MKSKLLVSASALVLVFVLSSCGSSEVLEPDDSAYIGAWGLASGSGTTGILVYDRLAAFSETNRGYLFEPGGTLRVRSMEYVFPGEFPSAVEYEGAWTEEKDLSLVLSHSYYSRQRVIRLVVLSINDRQMRCHVSEVK